MMLFMRDEEKRTEGEIKERILTLLEFGKTPEYCIKDIANRHHLTEEDAREYVDKYTSNSGDC